MIKKLILLLIILFVSSSYVFAGNPPDSAKSSLSPTESGSGQATADGKTEAKLTLKLKDNSDNVLAGDSVTLSISGNSVVINPSSATLDSSGSYNFTFTSRNPGTYSIDVKDTTTDTTLSGLGQVTFKETASCTDPAPGSAAKLISAEYIGSGQIKLTWEKAGDPVTYYLLAFGIKSGDYIYGNPNIGSHDTTTYTVGGLSSGKKYFFAIRAGNGCTPGIFSNEISQIASTPVIDTPQPLRTRTPIAIEDTPSPTPDETPKEIATPSPSEEPIIDVAERSKTSSIDRIVTLMTSVGIVLLIAYLLIWIKQKRNRKNRSSISSDNQIDQTTRP